MDALEKFERSRKRLAALKAELARPELTPARKTHLAGLVRAQQAALRLREKALASN
jgi:hypothetical protein